ncbi:beta-ketoacyl-[acyl-carrier-protein] synthase II [Nostoc sp. ATCC 43529]|nr:beta-ketoacyl-[acyl-carrier-protein] synthase II [Nostoc sp. ATCC 43529]
MEHGGSIEKKRVVVTGIGAITPVGNTALEFWDGLLAGKNGISHITQFDSSNYKTQIAGEVEGFEPLDYLDKKEAKRTVRFTQFAVAASRQALSDANFEITDLNCEQVGVIIGSGLGGMHWLEEQNQVLLTKGPQRISPFTIPLFIPNMAAGQTAIAVGAKGPNSCPVTACAAGANAIGDAFRLIQQGYAQAMLCGGTEAAITPMTVGGFSAAGALSRRNHDPARASRPFDRDRDGFVLGEGAGILLLEELQHALKRGAHIYAEIVGYGMTCDAYHMTTPSVMGEGASRAIRLALKDGNVYPEQVSYVNAHGTSTAINDSIETQAIKTALGKHAYTTVISSTKSMTGHLLGAAGGIEAVATTLAVYHDKVPPTTNLDNPDPLCDLQYSPHVATTLPMEVAISNSLGFGGHNVTLVFRKYCAQ